jgi:hypothetical protein
MLRLDDQRGGDGGVPSAFLGAATVGGDLTTAFLLLLWHVVIWWRLSLRLLQQEVILQQLSLLLLWKEVFCFFCIIRGGTILKLFGNSISPNFFRAFKWVILNVDLS